MKKSFTIVSKVALVCIVLFTGCKKEKATEPQKEETVTKDTITKDTVTYVGIDFAANTGYFHYFKSAGITAPGTYTNTAPSGYRAPYAYTTPSGLTAAKIVGIGIYGVDGNQDIYTYYSNGTMSKGISNDLSYYAAPVAYTTATGKTPSTIVGISIAKTGVVYTWYNDGTVSTGSTTNLAEVKTYFYTAATGKAFSSIIEMAIDRNNSDRVYTYYSDSTVSVGISNDLDYYAAPVPFK